MDAAYRAKVERAAERADGVEEILNRSAEHSCVVVEYLFRKATSSVEIITKSLVDATYGAPATVNAAIEFLRRDPECKIDLLVEGEITENNKLISAIRDAGLMARVTQTRVPAAVQSTYVDHVVVVDANHFRYQRSRANCEALIQFGNRATGARLHEHFVALKAKCQVASAPAR